MTYKAAAIVASCVFAFYVILLTAMGIYWFISRREHRRQLAEMEAQAKQYKETVFAHSTDGQVRQQSRTASIYSETRSVRSMFYEGPGRQHSGHSKNSSSSSDATERGYNSVHTNLIPLRQVSAPQSREQEDTQSEDRLSVYSNRSRTSSVSTLRYYAEAGADDEVPVIPNAVLVN